MAIHCSVGRHVEVFVVVEVGGDPVDLTGSQVDLDVIDVARVELAAEDQDALAVGGPLLALSGRINHSRIDDLVAVRGAVQCAHDRERLQKLVRADHDSRVQHLRPIGRHPHLTLLVDHESHARCV